jgi:hypothetical protein
MRPTKVDAQNNTMQQQQHQQDQQHQDQCYSSNSTSPASEGRLQQLEAFLDDLRVNSEGKVQESSRIDSNTSFESSLFQRHSTVQDVLRQPILPQNIVQQKQGDDSADQQSGPKQHSRLSSMDTAIVQNISNPDSLDLPVTVPTTSRDEQTLNMVLSDSGDEVNDDNDDVGDDKREIDASLSRSADSHDLTQNSSPTMVRTKLMDETTLKQKSSEKRGFLERAGFLRRKPRKNKNSTTYNSDSNPDGDEKQPPIPAKSSKPSHRRQRSGDAAAAKISTGSDQWKGMKLDRIPMPDCGDETDTTADTKKKSSNGSRSSNSGKHSFNRVKETIDRSEEYGQRKAKQQSESIDSRGLSLSTRSNPSKLDDNNNFTQPMNNRASEIAQFSQFALGTADSDDSPASPRPRPRRIKQRSYRAMRRAHLQRHSERPGSPHNTDQSSFFHPPPTTSSLPANYQQSPGMYSSPILSGYMASPSSRKMFSPNDAQSWQPRSSPPSFGGPSPPPPPPPVPLSSSWTSPNPLQQPLELLSSSWTASNPLQQPLPPYFPSYGHQRRYSELPAQGIPGSYPPPPPSLSASPSGHSFFPTPDSSSQLVSRPFNHQHTQNRLSIYGIPGPIPPPPTHHSNLRMPDKSSPMFTSDNQLLHRRQLSDIPKRAHSFDHLHSDENPENESDFFIGELDDPNVDVNTPHVEDGSYFSSDDDDSLEFERNINRLHAAHYEERVLRQNAGVTFSPFSSNQQKVSSSTDRRRYLPQTSMDGGDQDGSKYPTYICPICNTRQREFFTVTSAPRQFEGPGGFIAFYFAIYVIVSLYIFGLQEGWSKLDCIYFAVITLTTGMLKLTCFTFHGLDSYSAFGFSWFGRFCPHF